MEPKFQDFNIVDDGEMCYYKLKWNVLLQAG